MNKFILLLGVVLILSSFNALGFGPQTHFNVTMTALDRAPDGLIKTVIMNNLDGCFAGLEYPDVGIFKYYINFSDYAGLHNYNVPKQLLAIATSDKQRAFAYCYKLHLAEDSVSHNYFVPVAIKTTSLPNYIIHPIQELKIEGRYLDSRAYRLMEKHTEYDAFVTQATGQDWSQDAENLNFIMGGGKFYTNAYVPESVGWVGKFQNVFYTGINVFVPATVGVDYYNLAIDEAEAVMRGETNSLDPAGANALNSADADTSFWLYAISFVVILAGYIISWRMGWIGW